MGDKPALDLLDAGTDDVVEHLTEDLPVTPTRARGSAVESGIRHLVDHFSPSFPEVRTFDWEDATAEKKETESVKENIAMPLLTQQGIASESGILPPPDLDEKIAEPPSQPPPSRTTRELEMILSSEVEVQPLQQSEEMEKAETPDIYTKSDSETDSFQIEGRDRNHGGTKDVKWSEKTLRDEESRVNKWPKQYPNESKAYIPINIYATTATDLNTENELSVSEDNAPVSNEPIQVEVTAPALVGPGTDETDQKEIEEPSDDNVVKTELTSIEPSVGGEIMQPNGSIEVDVNKSEKSIGGSVIQSELEDHAMIDHSEDGVAVIQSDPLSEDPVVDHEAEEFEVRDINPVPQKLEEIAREDIEKAQQDDDYHYCGCDSPGLLCTIS